MLVITHAYLKFKKFKDLFVILNYYIINRSNYNIIKISIKYKNVKFDNLV